MEQWSIPWVKTPHGKKFHLFPFKFAPAFSPFQLFFITVFLFCCLVVFQFVFSTMQKYSNKRNIYGSVSAGREKRPLFVTFFKKVEGSCCQTKRYWWFFLLCGQLLWLVDAFKANFDHSFPRKPFFWHPQLDLFVKFYCIFNALVRPHLQR